MSLEALNYIDCEKVQGTNGRVVTGISYKIKNQNVFLDNWGNPKQGQGVRLAARDNPSHEQGYHNQLWSLIPTNNQSQYKIKNQNVFLDNWGNPKQGQRVRLAARDNPSHEQGYHNQLWSFIPQNYEIFADSKKLCVQAKDISSQKPFSSLGVKYLMEHHNQDTTGYITLNNTMLVKPFDLTIISAGPIIRVHNEQNNTHEDCSPGHPVVVNTNIIEMKDISFGHMRDTSFLGSKFGTGRTFESSRTNIAHAMPAGLLKSDNNHLGLGKILAGDSDLTALWGDYNLINFRNTPATTTLHEVNVNTDHNVNVETRQTLEAKAILEATANLNMNATAGVDFLGGLSGLVNNFF